MFTITTITSINSPMFSRIPHDRTTRLMKSKTATIYSTNRKNNILKEANNKNVSFRVVIQDNSVSHEDLFTNYELQERVQKIKQIMGRKLQECRNVEELVVIDVIQRLGLEYYFRDEIHDALRKHHGRFDTIEGGHDLHDTSLCFRLLRQHGYNVSSDVFNKFMNKDGQFKEELKNNMKGLISLFEASHLKLPGDYILDYAGEYCRNLLSNRKDLNPSEASIIQNTLSLPYHESIPRFTASDFLQNIDISMKLLHDCRGSNNPIWIEEMRNLARIDLAKDQITIQHEITEIRRWWEELRLPKELKLARNEPVKWHMWSVACLPGPYMTELRLELTKAISFIYIIDDIFDNYGTLEALTLFTDCITRWEIVSFDDNLPDYMIVCLRELFATTNEITNKIYAKHGFDPANYIKKVWAEYCSASLVQANWVASRYMPTVEEYMKNETITTGSYVAHAHMLVLLGEELKDPKGTDFSSIHPDISSLAARILRLWDDLGNSKDEHQRYDGSVIDCYLNEHEGSSPESARQYILEMIPDAWSRLNETLVSPSPFSADFKEAIANFARIIPIMYRYDENHRLVRLEELMQPLVTANK